MGMRILIVVLLCIVMGYFFYQQGKFRIDNERVGFFLLRGGYRAWWIRYSNGMTYYGNVLMQKQVDGTYKEVATNNKGRWVNLWCFPKFEHCDVRKILKRGI